MGYPVFQLWNKPRSSSTSSQLDELGEICKDLVKTFEPTSINPAQHLPRIEFSIPSDSPWIPVPVLTRQFNRLTGSVQDTVSIHAVPREYVQYRQQPSHQNENHESQSVQFRGNPEQQSLVSLSAELTIEKVNDIEIIQETGKILFQIRNYILSLVERLQTVLDTIPNQQHQLATVEGNECTLEEKHLDAIRELKKELINLEASIDSKLLHFTNQNNPFASLEWNDMKEHKEKIENLLKVLSASSIRNHLSIVHEQTQYDVLAQLIGLQKEVVRGIFEGRTMNDLNHETEEEAILRYLEDVSEYTSVSADDSILQILANLGFTENRAKYLAEKIESLPVKDHYSVCDLACGFVEDLFQNDLLLTNKVPHLPDYSKTPMSPYTESSFLRIKVGKPTECFNLHNDDQVQNSLAKIFSEGEMKQSDGFEYWYHGTHNQSASKIFLIGIKNNRGKPRKDFSNRSGFYLSDNFSAAHDWSKKCLIPNSSSTILQYRIPKSFWSDNPTGITLSRSDEADMKKWKNIIRYFRSDEEDIRDENLIRKLKQVPFIRGPLSTDGRWEDHERDNDWPKPLRNSWSQLCISQQPVSDKFNSYLHQVVFIIERPKGQVNVTNGAMAR